MSFGFKRRSRTVEEAISYAHRRGVMMFGAAGNNGMLEEIRYPASDPNVLCIHAAGGFGNSYRGNPTKRANHYNFSLLGIAVEGNAPLVEQPVRRSGTSQATAVAAGAAALILQLFHDNQKAIEDEWGSRSIAKPGPRSSALTACAESSARLARRGTTSM